MAKTTKSKLLALSLVTMLSFGILVLSTAAKADGLGTKEVFGTGGIFTGEGDTFDLKSSVITFFQLLLGGVIAYCLFYAVMAGARFAKAKDSADDRKKQLQALLSALGGVLISTLAVPFANTLRNGVGPGNQKEVLGTPCAGDAGNVIKAGTINDKGDCVDSGGRVLPTITPRPTTP